MGSYNFELGVVYRCGEVHYIAVSGNLLLGRSNGRWVEHCPPSRYRAVRDMSVQHLCQEWGVAPSDFDAQMLRHFTPAETEGRRRRSRLQLSSPTDWSDLRTHRFTLERRAG